MTGMAGMAGMTGMTGHDAYVGRANLSADAVAEPTEHF
jgi:hypothetical protein